MLIVTPPHCLQHDRQRWADVWVQWLIPKGDKSWRLCPKVILLVSRSKDALFHPGQLHWVVVKELTSYGYDAREAYVDTVSYGATVDQQHWVTVFSLRVTLPPDLETIDELEPRPASNLLTPVGLVPPHLWRHALER